MVIDWFNLVVYYEARLITKWYRKEFMMEDINIKGKISVVTGAAGGIGKAVAQALVSRGADVALLDKDGAKIEQIADEMNSKGYRAKAYQVDIGNSKEVEEIVKNIEQAMGPIEILINVAGVLKLGAIESFSDEDWNTTFRVNTDGVFYMSRSVIQRMARRGNGAIVTISSNAAEVPRMQMAAYAASKAASTMFTKCLGLEHAKDNIRCNIVSPGSTNTSMQSMLWADDSGMEHIIAGTPEAFRLGIPLKRIASPEDIAYAVLFFVSEQARHITMHNLCVDGGATLGV